MTLLSEPLLVRIERWVTYAPFTLRRLLLHPKDKAEWAKLRRTAAYQKVAGKLPVKFAGEDGEMPA